MGILIGIRRLLMEDRLRGVDYESGQLIQIQRQILSEKPMLRQVFKEFYQLCRRLDEELFSGQGARLEIGAGASLFKKFYPDVISSDIKKGDHLDRVLDAQQMDLPDGSVRAVYAINCFHHLPDPDRFFAELSRVLTPGGGCVLIEPFYGPLAAQFYRRAFDSEGFSTDQASWTGEDGMGVMQGANQALSWIIFERDRALFGDRHPNLEIASQQILGNFLRYFFSGGLNFKPLLPNLASAPLRLLEWFSKPLHRWCALHHVVVLRKAVQPLQAGGEE